LVATGTANPTYSLKYRYSTKEKEEWKVRLEDFIVRNQRKTSTDDTACEVPQFSYTFDMEKEQLVVKRDSSIGGKAETYTWHLDKIPSYYRTSP
jgi:hypothetical protein